MLVTSHTAISLTEEGQAFEAMYRRLWRRCVFLSLPTGNAKFLCFKCQVRLFQTLSELDKYFTICESSFLSVQKL